MSQRQGAINQCDVCGHEWLPKQGVDYTHCTSGKCRSRKWNKSGDSSTVEQAAHNCSVEGSNPSPRPITSQALRDIAAGKVSGTTDSLGAMGRDAGFLSAIIKTEDDSLERQAEIPVCGKTWWEDGLGYECLMDKGHKNPKHGQTDMVRHLDV